MRIEETTAIFESMGWTYSRDEWGNSFATFRQPDRYAVMYFGVRRLPIRWQMSLIISVKTEAFSDACAKIHPDCATNDSLVSHWTSPNFVVEDIVERDVRHVSKEALKWMLKLDLNRKIREHAALPTNAFGAKPIWHLAALALIGASDRLQSYLDSFDAGDRLGFVDYITRGHVERALRLAKDLAD